MQSERHSREDWYKAVRHRNLVPKARLCHWRPFTPEVSRCHVLNVCGVLVVDFFIFFCGNVAFTVSKLIDGRLLQTTNTNIANKVKSRVKIKNQDRRRVASISICLQIRTVDRFLLLLMFYWMIGKLEDLKRINIYFNSFLFNFYLVY